MKLSVNLVWLIMALLVLDACGRKAPLTVKPGTVFDTSQFASADDTVEFDDFFADEDKEVDEDEDEE